MTQNRFYSSTAAPTTLASGLASTGNPSVNSITGLPSSYPFTMLIDWGLATQEAISVTSAPTGTGPWSLPCTRGIDGTTGQGHSQGAIIVHGVTAEDYNEPQVHISTGTSGSSYPNVIHGLANGSAVVGTTDTQTLTNKTLTGATVSGGDLNITNSDATNPVLSVTNTHTAPSSSILRIYATTAGDTSFGIRVTGDTVNRYHVDSNGKIQWGAGGSASLDTDLYREGAGVLQTDGQLIAGSLEAESSAAAGLVLVVENSHTTPTAPSVLLAGETAADKLVGVQIIADTTMRLQIDTNGKLQWGPGGSTAVDTDLYRSGVGVLSTDNTLTATVGAQIGSATTAFGGGSGVLGLSNAGTAPSGAISNAVILYGAAGQLRMMDAAGFIQNITGSQLSGTTTLANSSAVTAIATLTVPANDPVTGATYFLQGCGVVSTTGTPTLTWASFWGGTGGTALPTTAAITQGSSVTNTIFNFQVLLQFTSSTAAICSQTLSYLIAAGGGAPTVNYQQSTTPTSLTTSSNEAFVFSAKWSAASSSNTLTSWYSAERIA